MKKENEILSEVVKNLAGVLTKSSVHNERHSDVIDTTYFLWKLSSVLELEDSGARSLALCRLLDLSVDLNNHLFDKK